MKYSIIMNSKFENGGKFMKHAYCPNCQKMTPYEGRNFWLVVILLFLGVLPGILYLLLVPKKCKICGASVK